jgi:hypothetical protein
MTSGREIGGRGWSFAVDTGGQEQERLTAGVQSAVYMVWIYTESLFCRGRSELRGYMYFRTPIFASTAEALLLDWCGLSPSMLRLSKGTAFEEKTWLTLECLPDDMNVSIKLLEHGSAPIGFFTRDQMNYYRMVAPADHHEIIEMIESGQFGVLDY